MMFQQYFSYIAVVIFIVGENRSTRRKPIKLQVTDKLIRKGFIKYALPERDSNCRRYVYFLIQTSTEKLFFFTSCTIFICLLKEMSIVKVYYLH